MSALKQIRFALPFILFAFIIVFLWRGLNLHPDQIPSPFINKPAPSFSLPELSNPNKIISNKDLLGHVVLVNVWASWCVACAEEHSSLVQLSDHVYFVGLNYKDDLLSAKKWLKQRGNPYQMVAVDQSGMTAIDWGVYGVPETFVLDKKGVIRYKLIGPIDKDAWTQHLNPLISQLQSELS